MINLQPISKSESSSGELLLVHSIFYTIQGEGPHCGRPATFIRLSGCNLQCPLCDTEYTNGAHWYPIQQIIDKVRFTRRRNVAIPLIVITGGEPFRQNIAPLVQLLLEIGDVQIETNGTLPPPIEWTDPQPGLSIVVSPKAAKIHPKIMELASAFKYIIKADSVGNDGLPMKVLDHSCGPLGVARPGSIPHDRIYLQPADEQDPIYNQRNIVAAKNSCLQFGYRIQLQIHKLIGVE